MGQSTIPERFEATGTDAAVSITRAVTQHRIGVRLVFDERLDADRLERAVRLSLDAEPILGCAFRTDSFKAYWQRIDDLDVAEAFTVVYSDRPDRDMVAFQSEALGDSGPQVAVRLFRSTEGDVVGIKVSHVLADGQAAKQYAYLLASIYSELGVDSAYIPKSNLDARPTAKDVWSHLDAAQRRDAKKAKSWAMPNWSVPSKGQSGQGMTYCSVALEPECFRAFKAYGNRRGATVNDMVLTAFFRACVESFDPPVGRPLSLMCTASLRRFLPDPEGLPIANVSISGSLDIERVDGESFDDTLDRIRERMAAWALASYGAGPALNAEKITALGYRMTKWLLEATFRMSGGPGMAYPWFTNMGVLDALRLGFDGHAPVAGSMFGPSAFGASIVPTISTYQDALTISMGFCDQDTDSNVVGRVLHSTEAELRACQDGVAAFAIGVSADRLD
ncbi:MAG: hypothetical protein Q7V14_03550 [Coriobacteriia bacterium]|nr:hypothetical protein [Coriobacteriia bacterium]